MHGGDRLVGLARSTARTISRVRRWRRSGRQQRIERRERHIEADARSWPHNRW